MLQEARDRLRDLASVQRLGRNLAWTGTKLVAFLALQEGVRRVLSGPLEADLECPPYLRVGEPFEAKVTVTAPFELERHELYFEDRWREGLNLTAGRHTETWRLIPHTPGLRPLTVVLKDREGNRIRRTRWVPVLPSFEAQNGGPKVLETTPE